MKNWYLPDDTPIICTWCGVELLTEEDKARESCAKCAEIHPRRFAVPAVAERAELNFSMAGVSGSGLPRPVNVTMTTSAVWEEPAPEEPKSFGEYAISEILAQELRGALRFADHTKRWLRYEDGVWHEITNSTAAELSVRAVEAHILEKISAAGSQDRRKRLAKLLERTYSSGALNGALYFLAGKDGFRTKPEEWDAHPWLLPCQNGVVDLNAFRILPHSPEYLFTKRVNANYEPNAPDREWRAHIGYFLPDAGVRRHVQRTLGVALVGKSLDEHLELWYGSGANGKSTTAEVVLSLLGGFATVAAPDLLIETRHERHPTQVADLVGKRLVFSHEVGDGRRLAENLVKRITGDGKQKARFMRGDFFEFEQTFDVFMLVNFKPTIVGRDAAIWRRIRLVPWLVRIDEAKRKPRDAVVMALSRESAGILNWLLEGLRDWQADHWWIAPAVEASTRQYCAESDRLASFLADDCEFSENFTASKSEVYAAYLLHCERNGDEAVGKKTFGDLLRARGIDEMRENRARKWRGLRLVNQVGA